MVIANYMASILLFYKCLACDISNVNGQILKNESTSYIAIILTCNPMKVITADTVTHRQLQRSVYMS